ncbi:spliceosome-associated protein 130 A-like isoform X2 [Cajanus cajan]|uniref:spliceosome-associated protein 130 A-like isoform X2 n=1 Tax=Cajanus cajan TaxID=3821 RepID=UPI00098D9A3F|nr:spliceosome-associated protein 130 A-like isoform X2 [Cajanus cajan]
MDKVGHAGRINADRLREALFVTGAKNLSSCSLTKTPTCLSIFKTFDPSSFHYCKYKRGMKTNFTYLLMIAFQDEIEEDPTGGRIKWEQGKLNRAPNKVEEIVQFHVGDVVTYFQKASLLPCGGEYIVF